MSLDPALPSALHMLFDAPSTAAELDLVELVLQPVGDFGGAISSEHGIGVLKRNYLGLSRNPRGVSRHAPRSASDNQTCCALRTCAGARLMRSTSSRSTRRASSDCPCWASSRA